MSIKIRIINFINVQEGYLNKTDNMAVKTIKSQRYLKICQF